MGAWGTQPCDNDGSGDLWYGIKKTWEEHGIENAVFNLHEKLKTDFPEWCETTQRKWEHLGMLQEFLLHVPTKPETEAKVFFADPLLPDVLWTAHQYCQDCLNDKKWISGWEDEQKLIDDAMVFQRNILDLIPYCCD